MVRIFCEGHRQCYCFSINTNVTSKKRGFHFCIQQYVSQTCKFQRWYKFDVFTVLYKKNWNSGCNKYDYKKQNAMSRKCQLCNETTKLVLTCLHFSNDMSHLCCSPKLISPIVLSSRYWLFPVSVLHICHIFMVEICIFNLKSALHRKYCTSTAVSL